MLYGGIYRGDDLVAEIRAPATMKMWNNYSYRLGDDGWRDMKFIDQQWYIVVETSADLEDGVEYKVVINFAGYGMDAEESEDRMKRGVFESELHKLGCYVTTPHTNYLMPVKDGEKIRTLSGIVKARKTTRRDDKGNVIESKDYVLNGKSKLRFSDD